MLLVVDNGSVYTKNLITFLETKKINFQILPFDKVELSKLDQYNSFILSGRRKNIKEMNAINSKIIKHSLSESKSLLGICYGAEILALTLGGTIRKTNSPVRGDNTVNVVSENQLVSGKLNVFQSHSYEISHLNNLMKCIAKSDNCNYEIISNEKQNIFGTQFHPEMSADGQKLIESFVSISLSS